jgi:mxaJ protein
MRLKIAAAVALVLAGCANGETGSGASDLPPGRAATPPPRTKTLRVCADPNNLPFSNERRGGFENRIAEIVAEELGAKVEYTWWAQRRGFIRNTLRSNRCDLVIGVPSSFELAAVTRPYYRSSYVFVTRADRNIRIESFDDPILKKLKIGVQLIGDDYANSPPAHALASRGITENVRGYSVYGDYSQPNPTARIIDAVASGEVDMAVVWGPLAGYFAKTQRTKLTLAPVSPEIDVPFLPFVFDISMAVRREDVALRQRLDAVIEHRRADIDGVLAEYGVPRLDSEPVS